MQTLDDPFATGWSPDYADARERLLAIAPTRGASITSYENDGARGPAGERLFTDVVRLGPDTAEAVLVVVSGTHGIEGFAGSALQSWLAASPDVVASADTAIVLVHGLNPYGFAHCRRVNEHNVDVNRSFVDHAAAPANPDYTLVHDAVVPADWDGEARIAGDAEIMRMLEERGWPFMQAALMKGQYEHPDGMFFGGTGTSWSNRTWRRIVRSHLAGAAPRIGFVDVHTGLGERGRPEAVLRGGADAGAYDRARAWFGDIVTRTSDGSASSTEIIGNTAVALAEGLGPDVELTAVALEFGTLPPTDVFQALRADNWLHSRAGGTGPLADAIRRGMEEAFAPPDPAWRADVLREGSRVLRAALDGVSGR